MGQVGLVKGMAVGHGGTILQVLDGFEPVCFVCGKVIPRENSFFYCSKTGRCWCYKCRCDDWCRNVYYDERVEKYLSCVEDDYHQHIFVVGLKFSDKSKNLNTS